MKYSVIIPVYNSEKTIKRCIESIALQNRSDVEIIIVDDGSTDGTESICKALQAEYNNIIYLYKENGGVSSARNEGLSVANGEFVMFVDSDDYVDEKCFDTIDKYTDSNADFYQFSFLITENYHIREVREVSECIIKAQNEKEAFISKGLVTRTINTSCAKIFRREIISNNNLKFCEALSTGEDLTFVFSFLLSANKIERHSDRIYFSDIGNENSLSRKYRENLAEQLIKAYDNMAEALHESKTTSPLISEALSWIFYRNAYSVANNLTENNLSFSERRKKLKAMCKLFGSKKIASIGFKCKIIALPINLRLVGVIDIISRTVNKFK